jgi:hypothetical protein
LEGRCVPTITHHQIEHARAFRGRNRHAFVVPPTARISTILRAASRNPSTGRADPIEQKKVRKFDASTLPA